MLNVKLAFHGYVHLFNIFFFVLFLFNRKKSRISFLVQLMINFSSIFQDVCNNTPNPLLISHCADFCKKCSPSSYKMIQEKSENTQ